MARKRSKSKARKKKTPKDQASGGGVSVSEDEAPAPTEAKPKRPKTSRKKKKAEANKTPPPTEDAPTDEATPDPQPTEPEPTEPEPTKPESAGPESAEPEPIEPESVEPEPQPTELDPDVIVLTLDDDLDDEAERARLIAEAGALTTEDGTDEAPSEASTDTGAGSVAAASDAADEAAGSETAAADAAYEAPTPGAEAVRHVPNRDIPTLTPAALAALTAIHREGMATLPGELVLDLGEGTTEEERDRLLAAALAHVEMQEAIYRVPSDSGEGRRWKGTIASSLFLLAALVIVVPPPAILPAPPATLSAADHLHGVRVSLLLQAQQIEAFRTREGRLPDSLDEVATALPGIRFVKSNNRLYQLVGYTPAGESVVYDSASPEPEFQAIDGAWAGPGTGS